MAEKPQSILIVGAGIAGTVLATLLLTNSSSTNSFNITVLERAPSIRPYGQNIDIRGSGLTIIRKLGLEPAIRAAMTNEVGLRWVDENDTIWVEVPAGKGDDAGSRSPTAEVEILRGRLAEVCYKRCKDVSDQAEKKGRKGVEFLFGDYLDRIEQAGDHVDVTFKKSGKRRSFDIVVGSDGLQSLTRKLAWGEAGETDRVKKVGMYAGFFSMPDNGQPDPWRKWFHTSMRRGIMLRPDGGHGRTTVLIYVVSDTDQRLIDLAGGRDVDAQKKILAEYFSGCGWQGDRVIEAMMKSEDFYYDLVGQVKMDRWDKGRVVLVGDAGYCASPLSGQGTTLALNGAYHLAGALLQHKDNFPAAVEQYTEKMRPIAERAQKLSPAQPYLFNPETAWGVWFLHRFMYFIQVSGIINLLIKVIGPKATSVDIVDDYRFKQLEAFQER